MGAIPQDENKFLFKKYGGKKGLDLTNLLSVSYPSPTPVDTQFVFVGVLKNGVYFYFVPHRKPRLTFKISAPFFQAQYDGKTENQRLPDGFIDKRVVFMAKFTRVGIACNIIALEDYNAHSFTFTPKSFTSLTLGFSPDPLKKETLQIEFFGLVEGGNLVSLYKCLMEEKFHE